MDGWKQRENVKGEDGGREFRKEEKIVTRMEGWVEGEKKKSRNNIPNKERNWGGGDKKGMNEGGMER